MSMNANEPGWVPEETARVARAAFPVGSLAIRIRDELGALFRDEEFSDAFPARGKPAWSPGRLAMVLVLQFVEGLTDRQAAEAVRARIDWKYALGLELTDSGFNFSVLSEFRDRLITLDGGRGVFDSILIAAQGRGLLAAGGKARTDSTHVASAARALNLLEFIAETLRFAMNAVAQGAPDWLGEHVRPDWFRHYSTKIDESRFPKKRDRRAEVAQRIGTDGMELLRLVWSPSAPPELRRLPEVELLRQAWVQHFHLEGDVVRQRERGDRPPGAMRLVTPHDPQARCSVHGDVKWDGYKAHFTETCDVGSVHLVTNVTTTVSCVPDDRMAAVVHASLAERNLLPEEHWVDTGYANAGSLAAARRDHDVALHGPLKPVNPRWTREKGTFGGQDDFTIDWDNDRAVCPNGATSTEWHHYRSQDGLPVIRVRFSPADCRPCPQLRECVFSPTAKRRELNLRPREEYEAMKEARKLQETDEWKTRYKIRAGVEGTISQAVQACGLRRSRYRGLKKTSLQHQLIGAAVNLIRIDAWLAGIPHASTRVSPLAALRPAA
ncbi:IS1182 family transposase [Streptomyces sp. NPDC099050]|uniref:IS1182 family transposase n=1 Tax=Streptomyces sp. NPDC099050 TaxID=3366100 RepID=UPI003825058F